MKHLDLFSGIGGFALACRMVGGIETVAFCEREPFAQKVLRKHWPDVPICNDIHELKGNDYGPIDLVTGGFPCQPYSLAGERRGNEDDRALWPQMLRVIREARPAWVLGENVAGIITLALDGVLADLEAEGYACEALVVPACAVDARHRRDRVWIVAYDGLREPVELSRGIETCRMGLGNSGKTLADASIGENYGRECRDMAEASGCGESGNSAADACGEALSIADSINGRAGTGWENGPEAGDYCRWLPEPGMGGSIDGLSAWMDRNRWLTVQSHTRILAYVIHGKDINHEAAKQRSREVLRTLRDFAQAQDVQWEAGGSSNISAKALLLAYLRKLEAMPIDEAWIQLEGKKVSRREMRSVRPGNKPSCSPSGPKHCQQHGGEYPDTLQDLSRLLALDSQAAWQSYRWSNAATVLSPWGDGWEVGLQRVAHGIPARVDRLKGLGNAIVPQVAAEIIGAMRRISQAVSEIRAA